MKYLLNIMKSGAKTLPAGEKVSMSAQRLLLSVLFLTGAALIPLQANAVPVVRGDSTTANQVVNNAAAWTTLRAVQVFNPGRTTGECIATGSSDGLNPNEKGRHQYRFTLSLDNLNPPVDTGFERTLEFQNQAAVRLVAPFNSNGGFTREITSENTIKEITSTGGVFNTSPGRHIIRWQARKIAPAANLTMDDSSLTVVCVDPQFQINDDFDDIPIRRAP